MGVENAKLFIGMISTDVALEKGSEPRNSISFNEVHKHAPGTKHNGADLPILSPMGKKSYCKDCGIDVDSKDPSFAKGYQFSKGSYIEVPKVLLDSVRVPTSGAIRIDDIVEAERLWQRPYMLTGSFYYLTPQKKAKFHDPAYGLILETLRPGMIGVGGTAIYGRTQAVALMAGQNTLMLYMLRYPDEIRNEPSVAVPPIDQAQLAMCKNIFGLLKKPDMNLNYADDLTAAKQKIIDNLVAGIPQVPQAAPPASVVSTNIEEQLKATLAALQQTKQPAVTESELPAAEQPKAKKKGKKGKAA